MSVQQGSGVERGTHGTLLSQIMIYVCKLSF